MIIKHKKLCYLLDNSTDIIICNVITYNYGIKVTKDKTYIKQLETFFYFLR